MEKTETNKLKKQLSSRHITMLALGVLLVRDYLKEVAKLLGLPVLVSLDFLIGGAVLFIVMNGLGKLVLDDGDTQHGLSGLVRPF